MAYGDVVIVHGVGVLAGASAFFGGQVGDYLVAEEVEVDPLVGRAAFGAAQQLAIEGAGFGEVSYWEGQMERTQAGSCEHDGRLVCG